MICRERGYSAGRRLAPGRYGQGAGSVILLGIQCDGKYSICLSIEGKYPNLINRS